MREAREIEKREKMEEMLLVPTFLGYLFSRSEKKKHRHITLDIRTNRIKDLDTDVEIQH